MHQGRIFDAPEQIAGPENHLFARCISGKKPKINQMDPGTATGFPLKQIITLGAFPAQIDDRPNAPDPGMVRNLIWVRLIGPPYAGANLMEVLKTLSQKPMILQDQLPPSPFSPGRRVQIRGDMGLALVFRGQFHERRDSRSG
jgi:hypothetical protein